MKNKKYIVLAILAIILIAGIAIVLLKGFNIEIGYANANEIEIHLDKAFNVNEINQMAQEVFGKDILVRNVELYNDSVSVTAREITDEKKGELINKINEKYGSQLNADNITINKVANVRIRDIIKNMILPFVIATSLVLLYMIIKYFKLGFGKVLLKTGFALVLAEAELMSLIAIARFPIGRTTTSLIVFTYMFTLIGITSRFEQQLQEIKAQEKAQEDEE